MFIIRESSFGGSGKLQLQLCDPLMVFEAIKMCLIGFLLDFSGLNDASDVTQQFIKASITVHFKSALNKTFMKVIFKNILAKQFQCISLLIKSYAIVVTVYMLTKQVL